MFHAKHLSTTLVLTVGLLTPAVMAGSLETQSNPVESRRHPHRPLRPGEYQ